MPFTCFHCMRTLNVIIFFGSLAAISSPFLFDEGALESMKELFRSNKAEILAKLIRFGKQNMGIVGIFYLGMLVLVLPHVVIVSLDNRTGLLSIVVIVVYIPIFIIAVVMAVSVHSPKTLAKFFLYPKFLKDGHIKEVCKEMNKLYSECCPNADNQREDLKDCVLFFLKKNRPTIAVRVTATSIPVQSLIAIVVELWGIIH